MSEGDIPGLSLVLIDSGRQIIRNYGYADKERKIPVTSHTLFQLGSCSKAFTALAFMELVRERSIDLNSYVSDYLPWFRASYKDSPVKITLLQLLHHTSGIPWQTISSIPASNDTDALTSTVEGLSGVELHHTPGKEYEYATIQYDVLALIIQKIAKEPFETYLRQKVFDPLHLDYTTIGSPMDSSQLATGYKVGFFRALPYSAPVYRGNNAAGYVISNALDMAAWLRCQLGLGDQDLYQDIELTHRRDGTVPLHGMSSYAMGWEVVLDGTDEIHHGGVNPNYTSYIAFRPGTKKGLVVLANSNSTYTPVIGDRIIRMMAGDEERKEFDPGNSNDKAFSLICLMILIYILASLGLIFWIVRGIVKGSRSFERPSFSATGKFLMSLMLALPFLYGLYLLPKAMAGFTWQAIFVWTPFSFKVMVILIVAAMSVSYVAGLISLCFPEKNEFRKSFPRILLISVLSGLANMILITLVTSALDSTMKLRYIVFYYVLTLLVYLLGRRYVQVSLIRYSRNLVHEIRIKLIDKIFCTSYQQFEKIDRGRVYTALNDDVDAIGESANMVVMLITSSFTAAGAFIYLATIAFWAALLTVGLIVLITITYYLVSKSTQRYFDEARDTRNVFMRLVNGIIDGFKEISLHRNKKMEYKKDVALSSSEYRDRMSTANIRFANAFMVGESLLVVLLGIVVLALPQLFPGIPHYILMSFVIVLLYLIGPVNAILSAGPSIMRLRTAWQRIKQFLPEIPANLDLGATQEAPDPVVNSIRAEGVRFRYKNDSDAEAFEVGPVNLEVSRGEILFIIGGNGSGKTTLAKLLTGLYEPDEGEVSINGKPVKGSQLSEHFSTVFSPYFLFEKLYNVDVSGRSEDISKYLKMLRLNEKVTITESKYSTIDLSGGQRKRLALLQCYLEDSPIYLFDEWAADQDPEYRNFFYRTLLPEMKMAGKIVIAITHDDNYFDVADKVLKMKQGKVDFETSEYTRSNIPIFS